MSRTISPHELKSLSDKKTVMLLDVRRQQDLVSDSDTLPGATWKNPELIAEWSKTLHKDQDVILYCMRGGSVSNTVLDLLLGLGVKARYIEGGIEACKAAGGMTTARQP
jgi:rhodanese-related sulfurtransferase